MDSDYLDVGLSAGVPASPSSWRRCEVVLDPPSSELLPPPSSGDLLTDTRSHWIQSPASSNSGPSCIPIVSVSMGGLPCQGEEGGGAAAAALCPALAPL